MSDNEYVITRQCWDCLFYMPIPDRFEVGRCAKREIEQEDQGTCGQFTRKSEGDRHESQPGGSRT